MIKSKQTFSFPRAVGWNEWLQAIPGEALPELEDKNNWKILLSKLLVFTICGLVFWSIVAILVTLCFLTHKILECSWIKGGKIKTKKPFEGSRVGISSALPYPYFEGSPHYTYNSADCQPSAETRAYILKNVVWPCQKSSYASLIPYTG